MSLIDFICLDRQCLLLNHRNDHVLSGDKSKYGLEALKSSPLLIATLFAALHLLDFFFNDPYRLLLKSKDHSINARKSAPRAWHAQAFVMPKLDLYAQ